MKRFRSDVGRFAIVPEWIVDRASAGAVKLFAVLGAKYADRDGLGAHPSRRRLADDLGVSMPTVDRLLRELVEAGALLSTPRTTATGGTAATEYQLRLANPEKLSPVLQGVVASDKGGNHSRHDPVKNGDTPSIAIDPESGSRINDPDPATPDPLIKLYEGIWTGRRRPAIEEWLDRISGAHSLECLTWAFGEIGLTANPTVHRLDGLLEQCEKIGHGPRDRWYESDLPKGVRNGRHETARVVTGGVDRTKYPKSDGWG
jgi:hypothetical protein